MGLNDIENGPSSIGSANSEVNSDPIEVLDWAIKTIKRNFAELFDADPIASTSIRKTAHGNYYLLTVKSHKSKYTFLIESGEHIILIEDQSNIR